MADDEDPETILANRISRFGIRNLHILRIGEPVGEQRWMEAVPGQCRGLANRFAWSEGESIQRHHLRIWWPCRFEAVEGGGHGRMVVTRLLAGDRIRQVIQDTATSYLAMEERWPTQAIMRSWPKGAPETIELDGNTIRLAAMEWGLEKCVIVTQEA